MALQRNAFRYDTCGCLLEYEWDDQPPADQRIHTPTRIIRSCGAHAAITDPVAHYNVVVAENRRKNRVHERLRETLPADVADDFTFSYDDSRVLHINLRRATALQRTALATWCATNIIDGSVVIT